MCVIQENCVVLVVWTPCKLYTSFLAPRTHFLNDKKQRERKQPEISKLSEDFC